MADLLTLSQIREGVRRKLSDDQYDATVIDEAANDFQNQLFTDHRIRRMETSTTLSVTSGETDMLLPSNFLTILNLTSFNSDNQFDTITDLYLPYAEFSNKYPNYAQAHQARPRIWTDFGNSIRFSAPSNAAYSFATDFLRVPELMEADGDEAEVTTTYREMFILGTLARVMDVNEDYDISQFEREKLDGLITAFVRNEGRSQIKVGPNIIRTRRRSVRSEW